MNFLRSAQLALTPLSPIHIGCGEDFEPTNYVIENGLLYGFDPSRAMLPENLRQRLSQLGDKADLLGIQRFFREHRQHFIPHAHVLMPVAAGLAADYEKQVGQVANNEANGNRVFNQLFIERASHSGDHPYIPGSSFKGALRTTLIDAINNGRRVTDPDERKKSNRLEERLLEGDFASSPLRLMKAADFMPAGEVSRQVLYAVNRKKDRVLDNDGMERQPRGIAARKECIAHGQYRALSSSVVLHDLSPHNNPKTTPAESRRPTDLYQVAKDCNRYHLQRLTKEIEVLDQRGLLNPAWKQAIDNLLTGEVGKLLHNGQAMLVRLGRYGGAESKTLSGEGVAQIKIMEGKGPDGRQKSSYQSTTKTVWLAAQTANDQKHLIPFGWALIEINPQRELPELKAWCEHEAASRPDMQAIYAEFASAQAAAIEQRDQQAAQRLAAEAAERAQVEAEHQRAEQLATMTAAQRAIDTFAEECKKHAAQLMGRLDKPNTAYHAKANQLAKTALESTDWTPEEKAAAADAIEEWLPRLVAVDAKDMRKKLKLNALRGQ
jgi:CRISPR-associated protein Csm5